MQPIEGIGVQWFGISNSFVTKMSYSPLWFSTAHFILDKNISCITNHAD